MLCLHMSVQDAHAVPVEARGGRGIPWSWSYSCQLQCEGWESKPGPEEEQS